MLANIECVIDLPVQGRSARDEKRQALKPSPDDRTLQDCGAPRGQPPKVSTRMFDGKPNKPVAINANT